METIHGLNTNGPAIVGTGVAFAVLATLALGLRFCSKRVARISWGSDDALLLLALFLYLTAEILVVRCESTILVDLPLLSTLTWFA